MIPAKLLVSLILSTVTCLGCSAEAPTTPDAKPKVKPDVAEKSDPKLVRTPGQMLLYLSEIEILREPSSELGQFQKMLGLFYTKQYHKAYDATNKLVDDHPSRLIYRNYRIMASITYCKSVEITDKIKAKAMAEDCMKVIAKDVDVLTDGDPVSQYFLMLDNVLDDDANHFSALLWLVHFNLMADKPTDEMMTAAKKCPSEALLWYCHPYFRDSKRVRTMLQIVLKPIVSDVKSQASRLTEQLEIDLNLFARIAAALEADEFQRKHGKRLNIVKKLMADLRDYQ